MNNAQIYSVTNPEGTKQTFEANLHFLLLIQIVIILFPIKFSFEDLSDTIAKIMHATA